MRFPRFIKLREDKGVDEASTGRELARMWELQNAAAPEQAMEEGEEEGEEE
jgi:hypothetical protein